MKFVWGIKKIKQPQKTHVIRQRRTTERLTKGTQIQLIGPKLLKIFFSEGPFIINMNCEYEVNKRN